MCRECQPIFTNKLTLISHNKAFYKIFLINGLRKSLYPFSQTSRDGEQNVILITYRFGKRTY